jgi:hypothetical protein
MKFADNIHKLLLTTIVFVFIKNILQIFFGLITSSHNKQYDSLILINPSNFTGSTLKFYLIYFFLYELLIIGISAYFLIYICLFFTIKRFGNKISLQILYLLFLYNIAILFFNVEINFFCIVIVLALGLMNWYVFKKFIN